MSELDRILERLREVPPVGDEAAARRLSEVGESRYQRHSAGIRDHVADEAAPGEERDAFDDDTGITIDLRPEPDDREGDAARPAVGAPHSEEGPSP